MDDMVVQINNGKKMKKMKKYLSEKYDQISEKKYTKKNLKKLFIIISNHIMHFVFYSIVTLYYIRYNKVSLSGIVLCVYVLKCAYFIIILQLEL